MRAHARKSYARWLFGAAAAFNVLIGLSLLFLRAVLAKVLHLDPIAGTNMVTANLTGMFVVLFGYAYLLIALDPEEYRRFISFGAIGKLLAVACVLFPWLTGMIPGTLPAVVAMDLAFAILFLDFLRRT